MMNVFFSDADAGYLKYLCHKKVMNTAIDNIVVLELDLMVGNIKDPFSVKSRYYEYESLYEERSDLVSKEIRKFKKLVKNETEICLWYSSIDTNEYLGMLAVIEWFSGKNVTIRLCDYGKICDSYIEDDEISKTKIEPPAQKILSENERSSLLEEWSKLKEENAPLRMIENGKVVSYPEDHFDRYIFEAIGTDAVRATEVFTYEPLFKKYPRVYCFLMYRLHRLIDSGEIIVVEEGMMEYGPYGMIKDFLRSIIKKAE